MIRRRTGRRLRLGIQQRLIVWLLVLGITPVIGTSLLGHWLMTRDATRAAGTRFAAVAERTAGLVDSELRHLLLDVGRTDPGFTGIARALGEPGLPRPDPTDSAAHAAAITGHPLAVELAAVRDADPTRYVRVTLADTTGLVLAATGPVPRAVARDEEWWRTAWNRGQGTNSTGRLLRVGDRWQLTVARPVRSETGAVVGILALLVDLSEMADIIEDGAPGATGVATVTSGYGDVLIAFSAAARRVPVVTTDRHHLFEPGGPAWQQGPGLLGQDAVMAAAPVRTTIDRRRTDFGGAGWYVTIEQDKAEILGPAHLFGRFAVGIALIIAGGLLVVGLFLSERISRPLRDLRDGARRIGAGRLDLKLDIATGDEIEELAREFNAMAARLRESYEGLENRVRTATAELARERNSLEAIVAALGEGLMVTDTDRRIVMWNRAAEAMTGFSAEEVIGRDLETVLQTEEDGHRRPGSPACVSTATGDSALTMLTRKDGHRLPVAVTASPLKDESGRDRGCVVIIRDVTREREVDRLKSEVVSTVSHELRSPLTSIIGFADLLDTPGLSAEKHRQYTRFIFTEGRRLERLIDDFLTLSRIETGRLELDLKDVDLREIAEELLTVETAADKRHALRCEIPAEFPTVRADRERIRRAVRNLITNAIKYSPAGGPVVVSAEVRGETVLVSVRDSGIGIRAEDLNRLFHRFQRLHRAERPEIRGSGLGLAITAGIVREHGGEIRVESEYGQGSTFTIVLPRSGPRHRPGDG